MPWHFLLSGRRFFTLISIQCRGVMLMGRDEPKEATIDRVKNKRKIIIIGMTLATLSVRKYLCISTVIVVILCQWWPVRAECMKCAEQKEEEEERKNVENQIKQSPLINRGAWWCLRHNHSLIALLVRVACIFRLVHAHAAYMSSNVVIINGHQLWRDDNKYAADAFSNIFSVVRLCCFSSLAKWMAPRKSEE